MTNETTHTGRRILLRLVGGIALVLVLLVGALHLPAVQTSVIRTVLNRVQPAGDSNITLGRSSGSPFNRLTLTDLALRTPGDSTSVDIDSLTVRLNPLNLLGSTIHLSSLEIRGVSFGIATRADGGLVLPQLESSDEAAPDTTAGTGFALDRFDIRRVEGRIGPSAEPAFELDALHLSGQDLSIEDSFAVGVDTLEATFSSADSPTGHLRLGADLRRDGHLRVDGELSTSRSDVVVVGTARYAPDLGNGSGNEDPAGPDLPIVDIDAVVRAAPLSYADLKPFIPALIADRELEIDLEAVGDASDLSFNMSARDDLDGRIEGNGAVYSTADSVAVTATLQIAEINGANHMVSDTALPSLASADLSAALSGPTWNRLDGRISADVQQLLAADISANSLRVDAQLTAGIATFETVARSGPASISLEGRARPLGTQRFAEFEGSFEGITERVGQSVDGSARNDTTGFLLNGSIAGRLELASSAADSTAANSAAANNPAGDSPLLSGILTTVLAESRLAACESVDGQVRLDLAPGRASVQAGLSACRTAPEGDLTNGAAGEISQDDSATRSSEADTPVGGTADRRPREGLSLGASLDLDDPRRTWTARLQTEGFDLSPFLAMEDALMFGGSIEASGTAPEDADVTFSANLDLKNIRAANAAIDSLSGRLSGTPIRLAVDATAVEQDGHMSVRGTLDLADRTSFAIDQASFNRFNATRAAGIPGQSVVLSGTMSGGLTLPAAEDSSALPDVDLTLSLDSTIVNETTFESISGSLRTRGTSITADIEALARASRFTVDGTAELRADSLRAAEGRVEFGGLDVGSLLAIDGISTRLTGVTEGSFDADRSPRLTANLNLEEGSSLNRFELEALEARLEGSLDRLGGDIRLRGASADMNASFGYSGSRLFVDGRAANIPVHELLGDTTNTLVLSTNLVLNASADSTGWNTMTVDLDSLTGRWNTFDVRSGIIRADVTPDRAIVDTFLVQGEFGRIRVAGVTPLSPRGPDSNLRLELESDASLATIPVISELGIGLSSLEAHGALRGPFERRRLNLSVDGSGLRYGTYGVTSLDGRILAEFDAENSLKSAEITTSTGVVDLGTMQIQKVETMTAFDGTNVDASVNATIDEERNLNVGATWYRDTSPQVVELNRLRAQLQGDRWQLASPSRLTLGDPLRLDGLVWYSDSQRIVITSSERSGFVQQFATIDSFKVDAVADLLGFHGLGGRLSGVFSTARQDSSTILQGNANALITAFGRDVGQMNGRLSLTETGLQLLASMTHETGKQITVSGTVPPTGAAEHLRVRADADGFPISWVRAFLDPELVSELGGAIEGRVDISGTADAPDWSGALTLTDGLVGIPELGRAGRSQRYSNIRASVDFEGDSLRVTEFTANSGSGRVTGDGSAILSRFSLEDFDIEFGANDFLAINNESYRAVVNGSGRLRGSLQRPVFSGDITVPSADFYLNDETTADAFEPVTLSDEDLRTLWERFGVRISAADTSSFDFYRAMKIEDFRVRIERDTWVRSKSNPEMDIQITGDLDVSKEHNSQEANVFGTIQVLPARSRIIQFGRRFDLTTGTLTFNGPAESPRMDLQAEYDVPSRQTQTSEVTIRLVVTGTPQDLEVEFQSDPQMELADIVSYIATGRPASESLQIGQNQSGTYLQSAAGIAMGQVRDLIQDLAGQNLGLDVIEITQNSTQGMTVTAGKYVTPEFYVAVSQPLSVGSGSERSGSNAESTTQVAMEYEIVQQLLLSLMNRGTILRVTLRWEYAF